MQIQCFFYQIFWILICVSELATRACQYAVFSISDHFNTTAPTLALVMLTGQLPWLTVVCDAWWRYRLCSAKLCRKGIWYSVKLRMAIRTPFLGSDGRYLISDGHKIICECCILIGWLSEFYFAGKSPENLNLFLFYPQFASLLLRSFVKLYKTFFLLSYFLPSC